MEETISLAFINESGEFVRYDGKTSIESKLEIQIAETFTEINQILNNENINDSEIRIAEKFRLCQHLNQFLADYRETRPQEKI
jgi:hypothetical protein